MLNRFLFQLLFFALTIGSASGQGGEASWVKLGEIDVAPGAASSRVDLTAVNGRSSAVQLRMARGSLALSRISVEYSNGQVFTDTSERKLALKDHTKLIDARPEGRFIDGVEVGYPKAGVPVVVAGIDTIDASRVSNDFLSLNHSDFADRAPLLQDIGRILKTGLGPPKLRYAPFEEIAGRSGIYWKYPTPH
jgi:hypothetical protein